MEVDNILDGLLSPPNSSAPAFHVVAPSIPGFGFSPAPRKPGWGARETGYAFHALMEQLGYTHYVIQGGDFGGFILRYMAGDNPSAVLSALDNMWLVPPNATDLQRYSLGLTSADENTTIATINNFVSELSGYRLIQETKPLQVAIGMTDSPVGFAMWIFNIMINTVDHYVWTPEEIITWSSGLPFPQHYCPHRILFTESRHFSAAYAPKTHRFRRLEFFTKRYADSEII